MRLHCNVYCESFPCQITKACVYLALYTSLTRSISPRFGQKCTVQSTVQSHSRLIHYLSGVRRARDQVSELSKTRGRKMMTLPYMPHIALHDGVGPIAV